MIYKKLSFKSYQEREDYFKTHYTKALGELALGTLIDKGFLTAPASAKYHGNYEGGLFDHSANVAKVLWNLSYNNHLNWKDGSIDRSPWVVGILHDLCKIDEYTAMRDADSGRICFYKHTNNSVIKGHGTKSVIYAQSMGIRLSDEERACMIYHMGAFTPKEEWNDYTHAVHEYPNVLWTHTADMIASQIMEV